MRLQAKDLVTSGNLLAGLASAVLAMRGELMAAAFALVVATIFDMMDGVVARWTGKQNLFGSEYDNVCDHMSYGVGPSFLLFAAYEPVFRVDLGLPGLLAFALTFAVASLPLVFGSLRFARFNTFRYDLPGYFLGLPRPASALALAGLVNSHLFSAGAPLRLAALALVLALGLLNVSTVPYPSHHGGGSRRAEVWLFPALLLAALGTVTVMGPLMGRIDRAWVGTVILGFLGIYAFLSPLRVPAADRVRAREHVRAVEG